MTSMRQTIATVIMSISVEKLLDPFPAKNNFEPTKLAALFKDRYEKLVHKSQVTSH